MSRGSAPLVQDPNNSSTTPLAASATFTGTVNRATVRRRNGKGRLRWCQPCHEARR